jgi:hypothetical protein
MANLVFSQTLRFQDQTDNTLLLRMLQAGSVVTDDNSPILTQGPSACGQVVADTGGTSYVVPVAVIPKRSKVSRTPAVFLERDAAGAWTLTFWIDLVRPAQDAGADPAIAFFPVTDVALALSSTVAGVSGALGTVTDLVPPDASVGRRLSASMPVSDPTAVANALRQDESVRLTLTATLHYRQPGTAAPTDQPGRVKGWPPPRWIPVDPGGITWNRGRAMSFPQSDPAAASDPAPGSDPAPDANVAHGSISEIRRQLEETGEVTDSGLVVNTGLIADSGLDTSIFRQSPAVLRLPDSPPPTSSTSSVVLTTDPSGLSAFFPPDPANRPIYYRENVAAGGNLDDGIDPDAVWIASPHGLWRESPVPNEYFILPSEYRLDVDLEHHSPAMSVLLVELPPDPNKPEAGWKVRMRFQLVPWFDPDEVERLRGEIATVAGVPWPELMVGGTDSVSYSASQWLSGLGGEVVGPQDGSGKDPKGFEYVVDATFGFYTLVANLLAPPQGTPSGLEGTVTFSLRTSADQQTPPTTRTVPAHIRLDRPTDTFLAAQFLPVEFPPDSTWPDGWRPPLYARITGVAGLPATVAGGSATLLVLDPVSGLPIDRAPASVEPASFTAAGAPAAAVLPAPDPTAPAGTAVPTGQPGQVILRLAQPADGALDPRIVGGVSVNLTGVTVQADAHAMLENVHNTASAAGLATKLKVSSYQLKHPEVLSPALADVFQLDVEIRRGSSAPTRVSLTRDEPEATLDLPFTLDDVVAGLRPDQPTFEFHRRNVTPAGNGAFSDWESVVGSTLLVTPVT